jgi:hypothetical protein
MCWVVIYDGLSWAETGTLSSIAGVTCAGRPRKARSRGKKGSTVITLCVIVTEVLSSSFKLALVLLHISEAILNRRFRIVKLGAGPFRQLTRWQSDRNKLRLYRFSHRFYSFLFLALPWSVCLITHRVIISQMRCGARIKYSRSWNVSAARIYI